MNIFGDKLIWILLGKKFPGLAVFTFCLLGILLGLGANSASLVSLEADLGFFLFDMAMNSF